jgi:citrate lyase subunit beta/citryl-CoA lyase
VIVNDLSALEIFFQTHSLSTIDTLLVPVHREQNTLKHFRSALMLSAHNLKHLNKIDELDADAVILNLEDGVSPELKPVALRQCAYFLTRLPSCNKKLIVRVNALDEGGIDEIRYLNAFKPDAIRVPKIRTADDVGKALKLVDETIELHLSIETKEAWSNLSILRLSERVTTFYLGILDLFAELQLPQELIAPANPTLGYMLSHFLITCKCSGVTPVSFVHQEYKALDTFKEWVLLEKKMGFRSKGCISPAQVGIVNEIFEIDAHMIDRAKKIVALFQEQQSKGITGFSDDILGFIDEPIYKGALALLNLAADSSRCI